MLECVKRAEHAMADKNAPRGYLPIDGIAAYDRAVQKLLFGADSPIVADRPRASPCRRSAAPAACKVGADFLRRFAPGAQVWISDPSWENHRALFEGAGFTVNTYAYYDAATRGLDFPAMIAALERIPAGGIVVLHACCHNPTGVDPDAAQWGRIIEVVRARGLVPVPRHRVPGLRRRHRRRRRGRAPVRGDARAAVRVELVLEVVLAVRRARRRAVGRRRPTRTRPRACCRRSSAWCARTTRTRRRTAARSSRWCSRRPSCARCGRPSSRRCATASSSCARRWSSACTSGCPGRDFRYMLAQRGMFSYSGLTKAQVQRLRDEYSIYAVDTGRICVAALNSRNVDYVADAIATVVRLGAAVLTRDGRILRYNSGLSDAGIAQLVERNLAKVEVASSRLVSRSRFSRESF